MAHRPPLLCARRQHAGRRSGQLTHRRVASHHRRRLGRGPRRRGRRDDLRLQWRGRHRGLRGRRRHEVDGPVPQRHLARVLRNRRGRNPLRVGRRARGVPARRHVALVHVGHREHGQLRPRRRPGRDDLRRGHRRREPVHGHPRGHVDGRGPAGCGALEAVVRVRRALQLPGGRRRRDGLPRRGDHDGHDALRVHAGDPWPGPRRSPERPVA